MSSNISCNYYNINNNHYAVCDDLSEITHGFIFYCPIHDVSAGLPAGQRYTGTIATYSCSPGYQLMGGSSLRACGLDGSWNGTELFCGNYYDYFITFA